MRPSVTTYTPAEVSGMSIETKIQFVHDVMALRTQIETLHHSTALGTAHDLARWVHSVERQLRILPLKLYLDYQEIALRADRALGLVMRNMRTIGLLSTVGARTDLGAPTLSSHGIRPRDIPRHARRFAELDPEVFEAALKQGREDRNLAAKHIARILNGEKGDAHTERVKVIARLAAEGRTSIEIARVVGMRDGYNVRAACERNDIDLPGDRTHRPVRPTERTATGFNHRNYVGLTNALNALGHVMSEADGALDPNVTADEAAAWVKDLARGRAQLTRLINTLKEAGSS